MGHKAVPYEQIRALVKSLQPDCLFTDHTHLNDPWDVDITNFEEPQGGFAPANNTYAGNQETKINASGGNDWFWAPNIGSLMSVTAIVDQHLRDAGTALDELPAQLSAQPRRGCWTPRSSRGWARWARPGARTRRARRCPRRGRRTNSRTRRPARPRPAAPPRTRSTASTTPTGTRSGARRARCPSRSRSISARASPTSACSPTCPSYSGNVALHRRRDHVVRHPDQHRTARRSPRRPRGRGRPTAR